MCKHFEQAVKIITHMIIYLLFSNNSGFWQGISTLNVEYIVRKDEETAVLLEVLN